MLNGQPCKLLADLFFEQLDAFHEVGVLLAETDVFLLEQPPRQSAHFPLRAHVGAWTHDDIHPVLLRQAAECGHVVIVREIEFALFLLVDVPEHVEAEGVHAKRLAHFYAVLPVGARYARVVHFGSFHDKRLSVEEECAFACFERSLRFLRERRHGKHHAQQGECE